MPRSFSLIAATIVALVAVAHHRAGAQGTPAELQAEGARTVTAMNQMPPRGQQLQPLYANTAAAGEAVVANQIMTEYQALDQPW